MGELTKPPLIASGVNSQTFNVVSLTTVRDTPRKFYSNVARTLRTCAYVYARIRAYTYVYACSFCVELRRFCARLRTYMQAHARIYALCLQCHQPISMYVTSADNCSYVRIYARIRTYTCAYTYVYVRSVSIKVKVKVRYLL